jgi:hypothetical protein
MSLKAGGDSNPIARSGTSGWRTLSMPLNLCERWHSRGRLGRSSLAPRKRAQPVEKLVKSFAFQRSYHLAHFKADRSENKIAD